MSHITDVKMRVKNLDAIDDMLATMGEGRLVRGQQSFRWYGRFMNDSSRYGNRDPKTFGQCEHAIVLDAGGYEIGLVRAADGDGWDLLYDSWGPGQRLEQAFGRDLSRLRQEYAVAVTQQRVHRTLARQGFRVQRENLPTGQVRLRLRRR